MFPSSYHVLDFVLDLGTSCETVIKPPDRCIKCQKRTEAAPPTPRKARQLVQEEPRPRAVITDMGEPVELQGHVTPVFHGSRQLRADLPAPQRVDREALARAWSQG